MAKMTNLAHPYVNAVFDLATAESSIDSWLASLEILANVAQNPNFSSLINNPEISKSVVLDTLLECIKSNDVRVKNFLSLLLTESRLEVLPEIYTLFKEKTEASRNSASALIQSAFPMNEENQQDFALLLTKKLGKKVNVTVEVNKELIGGVKILVNDLVIDASVKGRLEKLAAQII
jgi:F-type H+-transporting ATPase subunit delta